MKIEKKRSGRKSWKKITGSMSELRRVSETTHQPIKPASGSQPPHVDIPEKKEE
jgi:hypothetical protein